MKHPLLLPFIVALIALTSCREGDHFITEKHYREKVEARFGRVREMASNRTAELFGVFDQELSTREEEALKFLYAYMPLSDLADYDGAFYLANVKATLAARDTFAWGKTIPEVVFRHFVLPVRVNNENMDTSRMVFFMELKDRVKHLPMKEAVLEVNHWCHEKVTYKGTDGRTSAPLAAVKTAYGRCGEESTFTTAALRSVGIPARQCYTPRWAHSDDNHAWVEVWVDGKWHFIGACEPESDLDLAWFTAPAKRAMLVNTNVFGDYEGPEDVLVKDERFTRINILPNYAPTRRVVVTVVDELNHPVDSAVTEFQLYNYAEFYPLHKTWTDAKGHASLLTGYGDLVVWASAHGRYGYEKVSGNQSDTIVLELSLKPGKAYTEILDLTPPAEAEVTTTVSDSAKKANAARLEFEDRIRANYESTFIDSSKAIRLAATLKMNPDSLWWFLKQSRGNWREMTGFITGVNEGKRSWIFPLLSSVSEKDLRDVTPEVLEDMLLNSWKFEPLTNDRKLFEQYILSPRIDNEWLRPFKLLFQEKLDGEVIRDARANPKSLVEWVRTNIKIDPLANWGRAPLSPAGAFDLRMADRHSRDLLFVALCRSFGIPSRLEPGTRVPQYFSDAAWNDVYFEKPPAESDARGELVLLSMAGKERKPEYYIHYTIEKFTDGFFRSLDYEYDPQLKQFPASLSIAPGYYMMVTGNRISGGVVLARMQFFVVDQHRKETLTIELRDDPAPPPVLGMIDLRSFLQDLDQGKPVLLDPAPGMILAWLEPDKEPTKHFILDLKLKKQELGEWKGTILLLFRNEKEMNEFRKKNGPELPSTVRYFVADPTAISDLRKGARKTNAIGLPLVTFLSGKGEVLYLSVGYRIGTGDDLLKVIKR
jgi:transglutaminase-like putative cysteine protease